MLLHDIKSLLSPTFTDTYLTEQPDTPSNVVSIFFAGGFPPVDSLGEGVTYERPSFQVRVRHESALTAIDWATQVKDLLHGQTNITINSTLYMSITQAGDILPLGKDAQGRTELTINFNTKIKR